jgi:hypothetical protein
MMIFFKGDSLKTISSSIIFIGLTAVIISCAPGRYLRTEPAGTSGIEGSYSLMLYGGRYSEDIENLAILDKDDDPYAFAIYGREDNYTVQKNVPAKEALDKAQRFVSRHRSFMRSRLSSILDPVGNVIGYELRPLYQMIEFGDPDVLSVYYGIKDSTVIVHIWPRQELEHKEPFLFRRKLD